MQGTKRGQLTTVTFNDHYEDMVVSRHLLVYSLERKILFLQFYSIQRVNLHDPFSHSELNQWGSTYNSDF